MECCDLKGKCWYFLTFLTLQIGELVVASLRGTLCGSQADKD